MDSFNLIFQTFNEFFGWVASAGFLIGILVFIFFQNQPKEMRETLSLWLDGAGQENWARNCADFFDKLYGAKHRSWRCLISSAISSYIFIAIILFFAIKIFPGIGDRTLGNADLFTIFVIASLVNIAPDYVSLFQTRLFLKHVSRYKIYNKKIFFIILDIIATCFISWISIKYSILFIFDQKITIVELISFYSWASVFFFSTFLTSFILWIYFFSETIVKIIKSLRLGEFVFDIYGSPARQLGIIVGLATMVVAYPLAIAFERNETGRSKYDEIMCDMLPNHACKHVARLSFNDVEKVEFLLRSCDNIVGSKCVFNSEDYLGIEPSAVYRLYQSVCEAEYFQGCALAGFSKLYGINTEIEADKAASFFELSCLKNVYESCVQIYQNGLLSNDNLDTKKFLSEIEQLCEENGIYCGFLSALHMTTQFGQFNVTKAHQFAALGCDLGALNACANLYQIVVLQTFDSKSQVSRLDAFSELIDLCKQRLSAACATVVNLHYVDNDFKLDAFKLDSVKGLQKTLFNGCANDNHNSCAALIVVITDKNKLFENNHKILLEIEDACSKNYPFACNLHTAYRVHEHLALDKAQAQQAINFCNNRNGTSCQLLGWADRDNLLPNELKESPKSWWGKACQENDARSCHLLAKEIGEPLSAASPEDIEETMNLSHKACVLGHTEGCNTAWSIALGNNISRPSGFSIEQYAQDLVAGVEQGCFVDNANSCIFYAHAISSGLGVPLSIDRSLPFFKKACNLRSASGCELLGNLYLWGDHIEANISLAKKYYELACSYGSDKACALSLLPN